MSFLLGYDVGSSSIKASLVDSDSGDVVCSAGSPTREMEIMAARNGWAEQDPSTWWEHICNATAMLRDNSGVDLADVSAVGISYQMHGLVLIDESRNVLRPSIIWCDSRAVEIGNAAAAELGEKNCLEKILNLPGNFTASKLKWVKENEPEIYARIYKMMLPGDYIGMKLTDRIVTTVSGLSEGMMWDFSSSGTADFLLDHYGISKDLIPDVEDTFRVHGEISSTAAAELGLKAGTPVSYRAGDQPNNALSLNVLNPGEVAVTAGTSGVVYGVSDQRKYDPMSRVNIFAHVNHTAETDRLGVLLCVNGTGILNSWLKHNVVETGVDYAEMNQLAAGAPVGSAGLKIYPYGNGAERTLQNRDMGASVEGLNFNIHDRSHMLRAGQEGIVFALNYGLDIMTQTGMSISTARAGFANMFMSDLFATAFATVTGANVELYNTDGSAGAARGAGIGSGAFTVEEAFSGLKVQRTVEPQADLKDSYDESYSQWKATLEDKLKG